MLFFLIFICFASFSEAAAPLNTLKQGDMISSSTTLVSAKKIFTLGFFSPMDSNFSYLGIWYTKQSPTDHPAWIANRNTPIYNNSGVLCIDPENGKLSITHNGGNPIELYSSSGILTSNRTAILSDSGNFALKEGNVVLWQSFDYPTDTLLPGMKLGFSHKTNQKWSLTSWVAESEPAPGPFTLEWEPRERGLIVKRRGMVYWTSGLLKNKDFEYIVPKVGPSDHNYIFKNVTTKDEEYFSYSLSEPIYIFKDRKLISGWQLHYRGSIYDSEGRSTIAEADLCYGYNTRGPNPNEAGCELWEQPKCRNEHQMFELQTGFFDDSVEVSDPNKSLGYSDCRIKCWEDCECLSFSNNGETGCLFWRGRNLEFQNSGSSPRMYIVKSYPTNKSKFTSQAILIPITSF